MSTTINFDVIQEETLIVLRQRNVGIEEQDGYKPNTPNIGDHEYYEWYEVTFPAGTTHNKTSHGLEYYKIPTGEAFCANWIGPNKRELWLCDNFIIDTPVWEPLKLANLELTPQDLEDFDSGLSSIINEGFDMETSVMRAKDLRAKLKPYLSNNCVLSIKEGE